MKNVYFIVTLVLLVSFLLMPLLAVEQQKAPSTAETSSAAPNEQSQLEGVDSFSVYLSGEDKTVTLSREEYLLGVLAAEMSPDYHAEALKAQALAAYTFAYRKHLQNTSGTYDLTTDSSLDQGYLNARQRTEKWGEKAEEYEKKLKEAIAAVAGQLIVYDGQPILAAYHAISPGNTETAENVWGTACPYLQCENSAVDLLAPGYLSEVKLSTEDFVKGLSALECTVSGEATAYIGESQKSEAGTVLNITLCGKEVTGAQVRKAFSLRSAAFELSYAEGTFTFTVSGYGHGVGMSQFGANYMAQQGAGYREILAAYYRGASVVQLKTK